MRQLEVPSLTFCPWVSWKKRKEIDNSEYPGIYLISITNKEILRRLPEFNDVAYIGMTNSQKGLRGRWAQFNNSIHGKYGHSGGNTIFKDLGHYESWNQKLYVSAMSIVCNTVEQSYEDLIKMGWVAYLEYEAFAKYTKVVIGSKRPKYNKK